MNATAKKASHVLRSTDSYPSLSKDGDILAGGLGLRFRGFNGGLHNIGA